MNLLNSFPDESTLLAMFTDIDVLSVNAHIHTPYSFSAFNDIPEVFSQAVSEDIALLGINDFFVADGYDSFYHEAFKNSIYPLFNIEFIGLMKQEQKSGIRINDPNNPGRCYFCGKGLDFPFHVERNVSIKLAEIIRLSQEQVKAMIYRLNKLFREIDPQISFSYEEVKRQYSKNLVRERHLAKAVRVAVFDKYIDAESRLSLFTRLFAGKPPLSSFSDIPALENEIRSNLLKAGGSAFVEEDESTFLSIDEITAIILNAGGIPCYPVLLDDKQGTYTEFEHSADKLFHKLSDMKVNCIELIPGRNDALHLENFVSFFQSKNFIILMGTEHNTPEKGPLTCSTRGNKPLSAKMQRIAYEGACVVAAHQYFRARGKQGYISSKGEPDMNKKEYFIRMGNALIHYLNKQKLS